MYFHKSDFLKDLDRSIIGGSGFIQLVDEVGDRWKTYTRDYNGMSIQNVDQFLD
jgi:hypothetical protein